MWTTYIVIAPIINREEKRNTKVGFCAVLSLGVAGNFVTYFPSNLEGLAEELFKLAQLQIMLVNSAHQSSQLKLTNAYLISQHQ